MLIEARNNTRQIVLPVCTMPITAGGDLDYKRAALSGTCFLIGRRGYALTAAHVINDIKDDGRVFFPISGGWEVCAITAADTHPKEDVGIIKVDLPFEVVSPVIFAADEPFPGQEYHMWSYPDVIAKEVKHHETADGEGLLFNPSPVYFRGYIRRKIAYSPNPNISIYLGDNFYEVSEIGGECCSGSPLTTIADLPGVFAIYIGEAHADRKCAYATNLMKLLDWVPSILGKPLRYEVIGPPKGATVSFENPDKEVIDKR